MFPVSKAFLTLLHQWVNIAGDRHNLFRRGRKSVTPLSMVQTVPRLPLPTVLIPSQRLRQRLPVPQSMKPAGAAQGAKLPVMVWIHGGGFVFGSGVFSDFSGSSFTEKDVILVSINYRLGRLGFFAFPALNKEHPEEPKGNYAYMDQ